MSWNIHLHTSRRLSIEKSSMKQIYGGDQYIQGIYPEVHRYFLSDLMDPASLATLVFINRHDLHHFTYAEINRKIEIANSIPVQ